MWMEANRQIYDYLTAGGMDVIKLPNQRLFLLVFLFPVFAKKNINFTDNGNYCIIAILSKAKTFSTIGCAG